MIVMAVSLPPLSRELLFFQRPPALTSTPFENIAFPDVTSLRLAYLTEIQHTPRFLQGFRISLPCITYFHPCQHDHGRADSQ